MAYELTARFDGGAMPAPRIISQEEAKLVGYILQEFSQFYTWRNTFAAQWEEAAELIHPTHRNTFFYGNWNFPGQKKTQQQIDANGMLANHRFAAICDSLLTPRNSKWHGLEASNPYVNKQRGVKEWFEEVIRILFKLRYHPLANFSAQNNSNFQSLGAFGNATMFIDAFDGRHYGGYMGLRYRAIPLGETFYGENHQGIVDRVIRWFRMTAYQAAQKWGLHALPANLLAPLQQNSQWPYNFLHCVKPRDDYDPRRMDVKGQPFSSYYVSIEGQCLMAPEGGFTTFPYAVSRYDQHPLEVYGRGPAQIVLPSLKTLNAEKATFLTAGHRASNPVLLTADDGIVGMELRPGAMNKGGVTADGKTLVHTLPVGDIQISKEMMAEERSIIQDVFLVTLFQILTETPQMTATEVIERTNEKGILLAPTIGRQQNEYLGPMVTREVSLAIRMGLVPPPPRVMIEAGGEYEITYTSPLARAARAQEAAGFVRTVETVRELVNITQDMSLLDPFNFDVAIAEIAEIQGTPISWMATDDEIAAKRQARAAQMAKQQQIQAAPAQAAMMKAQAVAAKSGLPTAQQTPVLGVQ
jgi:hypothetical protein